MTQKTIKPYYAEKRTRDEMIRQLYHGEGYSMNQLVVLLGHSKHTILKAIHAKGRNSKDEPVAQSSK